MTNPTQIHFGYPDTLIHEYDHWTVLLREQQVTLGSVILCAKSDVTKFSALVPEAFVEMNRVIMDIERALKNAFEYDKINYLMLMMVDLNVHFHVIPRYAKKRSACGLKISDSGWPMASNLGDVKALKSSERFDLCLHITNFW